MCDVMRADEKQEEREGEGREEKNYDGATMNKGERAEGRAGAKGAGTWEATSNVTKELRRARACSVRLSHSSVAVDLSCW